MMISSDNEGSDDTNVRILSAEIKFLRARIDSLEHHMWRDYSIEVRVLKSQLNKKLEALQEKHL